MALNSAHNVSRTHVPTSCVFARLGFLNSSNNNNQQQPTTNNNATIVLLLLVYYLVYYDGSLCGSNPDGFMAETEA
eukprot:4130370-Amphidinium_carterae.1